MISMLPGEHCPSAEAAVDLLAAAGCTDAPGLRRLASAPELLVFDLLAVHPETPRDVLEMLADHPDPNLRLLVAGHLGTPRGVLSRLAGDMPEIREVVARNPNACGNVLEGLAADSVAAVRAAAAAGVLSEATLAQLAADESAPVRRAVAANPWVPLPVATGLLEDPDEEVRALARVAPSVLSSTISPPSNLDPAFTTEHLHGFAESDDESVRRGVVEHPNASTAMITRAARDAADLVRWQVAGRVPLPWWIAELLTTDASPHVQAKLADNPRTDGKALVALASSPHWHVRARSGEPARFTGAVGHAERRSCRRCARRRGRQPGNARTACSRFALRRRRTGPHCGPQGTSLLGGNRSSRR